MATTRQGQRPAPASPPINAPGTPGRKAAGGRPTRAAALQLEQRILDVAAALFASQGYAATTMEQVADACKAGKDTIYRRYASKGALFGALMDRLRTEIIAELGACTPPSGPPLARLREFARALLEVNLRPQLVALNRVALGEAVPAKGVPPPSSTDDPFMQRLATLIQAAQADDALAEGDPFFIAEQLLYATSIRPLVATMLGDAQFADPAHRQSYFDQAWQLFFDGASQRPVSRATTRS
ncbi:Transcriptional regulator, TetR family [plant metagenome]|uniref:Transcriptional regulator, TetR family n=1 Tax=plant metagenome TaxID=1297885 RepID=A0A484RWW3_9ZZZZ